MDHSPIQADTIAALATPAGRGGIAIIRVSGSKVKSLLFDITGKNLPPRQASYLPFLGSNSEILDQGVALFFPSPHSFTGEDVLELHGHGSPVIVDLILKRLIDLGVRLARPGEFSERAFLNNKMDLTQAEAISDLINAASEQAARSAIRSLQGEFSKVIHEINDAIIYLRLYVEASIDFVDEEIDFLNHEKITTDLKKIITRLNEVETSATQGHFLQEGIRAVIAGKPNVGKSSLLNRLSEKELAIVTDIPGTTRDVLRHEIVINGMPMHIIDTAGLRDSDDIVEREGIRRAHLEIEQADIILYVVDDLTLPDLSKKTPIIYIRNKIDLEGNEPSIQNVNGKTLISLSAKTGLGLSLLKDQIQSQVGFNGDSEGLFLARRRHLDAISRAKQHLNLAFSQLELLAEDLRQAHDALGEITGTFTTDDLLGKIFSSFCIGK